MIPLVLLSPGEQAEIVSIRDNPGGKTVAMVIYQGGTFLGLGG